MLEKYQNKYRLASARLQSWDYRWNAAYFVTICTGKGEHFFGQIIDGEMQLSKMGIIADIIWFEKKNCAKNIELGQFIVMPNHIHGIIIIDNPAGDNADHYEEVETSQAMSLPAKPPSTPGQKRFQNQGKNSLSSIIGSYKSAVTKHANRLSIEFGWQPRFHEHIIRTLADFYRIANYIENNLRKWSKDKF
jgi:REP element-mobilizing transposase RayT